MPPTGPEDRKDGAQHGERPEKPESPAIPAAPDEALREAGQSGLPPGVGEESPPQTVQQYDRFGWPIPEGIEANQADYRPETSARDDATRQDSPPSGEQPRAQGYTPRDTSSWRVPPTPGAPPRSPHSGQFLTQEPAPNQPSHGPYSGQFPTQPPPQQSGAFPISPPPPPDATRSGQFPIAPTDPVYRSGAYAVPSEPGGSGYAVTASGPIPQSPYISGPIPRVDEQSGAMRRSGSLAYPSEVTSTGSRRVIVAPDAGVGSLLADRPALGFLLAAVVLAGAMIAYIALRYSHFPSQIALHFGPAGSSQPNRIGEKRELWTIPFIVGIVLAANTALAWAVYHYDRFAARLLTLGCALVAAIAWVVLLTLLHR